MKTRLTRLLGLRYPIVQAGMSWASSCVDLPLAVANAGGLGVIAAGPMHVEDFRRTVQAVKHAVRGTFAVNIPLYRPAAAQLLDISYEERVPVIIASQGGPGAHLDRFHTIGSRWLHVVSTLEHARKAAAAGVDGLVVVGAEAGGHPPANQVGTLVAVRRVLQEIDTPVVAGGGVADGFGIAAMLALGADAVQLGTRFLMTRESNVHANYKQAGLAADVDGTTLVGRKLPVRILRNLFAAAVAEAEATDMPADDYQALLKQSSLRLAALDGDMDWGLTEVGQSIGLIHDLPTAADVMTRLVEELSTACARLNAAVADQEPE